VAVDQRVREKELRKICVEKRENFVKSQRLKKYGPLDPEGTCGGDPRPSEGENFGEK
jgi:hypothetical protein